MSLLDFLTQPRTQYQGARPTSIDVPGGNIEQGLLPPTQTQKPSLLNDALHFLMQPGTLAAIGAGVKGLGGDDSGVGQAIQIGQNTQQQQFAARQMAEKKAALKAKNAAFKAAYKPDASGKMRFDPAAYAAALGDTGEADLGEIANLHNALAPKVGVSGDTPYSISDEGQVEWGEPRGPSESERQAEARAAEIERHNREMERLMGGRAESYDYSVRHRAGRGGGGRGGGGAGPSWLPPGAKVVHVPGGQ